MSRISLHKMFTEKLEEIPFNPLVFSGGEPHVQLKSEDVYNQYLWIDARCGNANDFMLMLALADAVKAMHPKHLGLFLPYFPGARQDRRQVGTPFTLKVYADIINSIGFDCVVVLDPHSDVTAALVERLKIISAYEVMWSLSHEGWICPDAGAEKRVHTAAEEFGQTNIYHARKCRDVKTGKLSGFYCEEIPKPGRYLIVDDICDGGGTFNGLFDVITKKDYIFDLFVSHGIFSKGLSELLKRFDKIYTTDSFPHTYTHPRLLVQEVHSLGAAVIRKAI